MFLREFKGLRTTHKMCFLLGGGHGGLFVVGGNSRHSRTDLRLDKTDSEKPSDNWNLPTSVESLQAEHLVQVYSSSGKRLCI